MTLPASGTLSMSAINTELGRTSNTANTKLSELSDGTHGTINVTNLNDNKPDTSTPHVMSEFHKYEHSVTLATTPASFSQFSNGSHNSAGTITVTHAEHSTFYVSSKPSWVTITSGNEGSSLKDTGDGTVTFSVAANSGSARSGNIVVTFDVGTTGGGLTDANTTTTRSTAVSQAAASGGGGGGGGGGRGGGGEAP
tara:strand:+ start:668 stop:1255 length:588 start_codon:yes stop_codon:yes gene_type:complete